MASYVADLSMPDPKTRENKEFSNARNRGIVTSRTWGGEKTQGIQKARKRLISRFQTPGLLHFPQLSRSQEVFSLKNVREVFWTREWQAQTRGLAAH